MAGERDRDEVARLVREWMDAARRKDLPAMRALCPRGTIKVADEALNINDESTLARLLLFPEEPLLAPAKPDVTIDGDAAGVEPIRMTTLHESRLVMLSFRRGDDGWRVEKCRLEPSGPIEEGLPGLGSEFVRQTEEWAASGLAWARGTLESNPPQGGDRTLRVSAHLMLDQVLHLNSSTSLHAVRDFAHRCAERAIEEMHSESVTEGAIVWKLYNHGWVVKTANHCWAHDFYEGPGGMALSARHVDGVLDAVEALFCSHWHGDHSSIPVIRRALAKGLPVFTAPTPDAAKGDMLRENVNNVTDFSGVPRSISVPGPFEEGTVGGIRFRAHPGHQDELPNTIFMVQADGMTIVQTGDQYNEDDYQWLRGIGEHERVDVCLPWMVELNRLVEAVRPRVVIPGHQNELGHLFEHREPYDQAYEKLRPLDVEWHVLSWGEKVRISPAG